MSDEFESLWCTIDARLRHVDAAERELWRLRLIRRLRHFGVVGSNPGSTPMRLIHPKQTGGSMPRLDSPLCQCGDPRRSHDDDGACMACHCPMYGNEDSH